MSSFKAEVQVSRESAWTSNRLRFATEVEARGYVKDLMWRWLSVTDSRVVASEDPVTHTWKGGRLATHPV